MAGAFLAAAITAIPFVINSILFMRAFDWEFYVQRFSYEPGRAPFSDYGLFLHFLLPSVVALLYAVFRKPSETKGIVLRVWAVLGLAYAIVIHLRVLLGFAQASDHFWRLSLGIPASLWCIGAGFDLVRSQTVGWNKATTIVRLAAIVLPFALLARTATGEIHFLRKPSALARISQEQRGMLEKLNCMKQVLKPGEGFMTNEPALNYHVMANLKGLPFVATGLSPVPVEHLTKRYLLSSYLTGHDELRYPDRADRSAEGYVHEKDLQLYLYVNLFGATWSDVALENRVKELYELWDPKGLEWADWKEALSTVKAVYVNSQREALALPRLERLFMIREEVVCESGKALRVSLKE
jgi:hypothetical protein